jgi:hypothetical protein
MNKSPAEKNVMQAGNQECAVPQALDFLCHNIGGDARFGPASPCFRDGPKNRTSDADFASDIPR